MTDYPSKDTAALGAPPADTYPAPGGVGNPARPVAPLPINGLLSPDDRDLS